MVFASEIGVNNYVYPMVTVRFRGLRTERLESFDLCTAFVADAHRQSIIGVRIEAGNVDSQQLQRCALFGSKQIGTAIDGLIAQTRSTSVHHTVLVYFCILCLVMLVGDLGNSLIF